MQLAPSAFLASAAACANLSGSSLQSSCGHSSPYDLGARGLEVQQCRMLEAEVGTNVLAICLKHPADATAQIKAKKKEILKFDFAALLSSSASYVAKVAKTTS